MLTGIAKLEMLKDSPETLDWFYVSPAASFGAWIPQHVTGTYRTSGDVLLKDDDGNSEISGADLALAVLDEIEEPRHQRPASTSPTDHRRRVLGSSMLGGPVRRACPVHARWEARTRRVVPSRQTPPGRHPYRRVRARWTRRFTAS